MSNYRDYIDRKRKEHGNKFDSSKLFYQFIPAFNSGERIEVDFYHDEKPIYSLRGTVGVTTGWKPAFLLMLRRSDVGSSCILGENDRIVPLSRNYRAKYQEG